MATVPPRWFHAASSLGSTIYFTGGTTQDSTGKALLLSDTIGLDVSQAWETSSPPLNTLAEVPATVSGHVMSKISGTTQLLIAGGESTSPLTQASFTYLFETKTGSWSVVKPATPTLPNHRLYSAAIATGKDGLLLEGGYLTTVANGTFAPSLVSLNPAAKFQPSSTTPVALAANAPALARHTMTLTTDGQAVILGGTSSTPRTENIALLDITSNTWTKRFRPVGQYVPDDSSNKSKLSVGAVLGIAFVFTALIVGGAFHLLVRRRKRQTRNTLARQNMGDHTARSAVRSSASNEDRSLFRKLTSLLGIGGSSSSRSRDNSRRSVRYSDMQLHSNAMAISSRMTQMGYSPVSLGYPENVVEHGSGQVSVSSYIYPNQACVETEKQVQDGQETQIVFHTLTQAQQEALKLSKQPPSNKSKLYQLDY
ncbi:hypothetical protein BGZ90_006930 [Linnemannia elongata]|nr:hypothetical protein BGZ90_006930 [Linnemannia elongata]